MQNTKRILVAIDPQVDFCDPKGALYVAGAEKDMDRIAAMIKKNPKGFSDIQVTLDSHFQVHIAHPISWVDSNGNHPAPFTQITLSDVESGRYRAFKPGLQRRFEEYVRSLESNGRYVLTIWNPHCLIGSAGHGVHPVLFDALQEWERQVYGFVGYTPKGSNFLTEHYSAVQADVQYPDDPTTQLNTRFIQTLEEADEVLITGEALNFCVANTFRDVADNFSNVDYVKKLVLIEDACSEIPGLESLTKDFMDYMLPKGMRIARTTDF